MKEHPYGLKTTPRHERRRRKVYRLPADYNLMKAYGKSVYLDDETTIKRQCSPSSHEFADSSQVKNEFGKDIVRKFVEYNRERERKREQSPSSVESP